MDIGRILHEFVHVLGMFHMHTIIDRDKYVKFNVSYLSDSIKIKFSIFVGRDTMGKCCTVSVSSQ